MKIIVTGKAFREAGYYLGAAIVLGVIGCLGAAFIYDCLTFWGLVK